MCFFVMHFWTSVGVMLVVVTAVAITAVATIAIFKILIRAFTAATTAAAIATVAMIAPATTAIALFEWPTTFGRTLAALIKFGFIGSRCGRSFGGSGFGFRGFVLILVFYIVQAVALLCG
jgi:hypothetical protein